MYIYYIYITYETRSRVIKMFYLRFFIPIASTIRLFRYWYNYSCENFDEFCFDNDLIQDIFTVGYYHYTGAHWLLDKAHAIRREIRRSVKV